MSEPLRRRVWS